VTLDEMREIVLGFPGAVEGASYGQPSFLVNKKFFTRLRREDQSLVLLDVSHDEREMRRAGAHVEPAPRLVPKLPRPPLAPDRAEEAGEGARRGGVSHLSPLREKGALSELVVDHRVEVAEHLGDLLLGGEVAQQLVRGGGRGGFGDDEAGHDRAALRQHQLLALGQGGQGLGDARRQVVEVDLLHAGRDLSASRISVSSTSVGDGAGGGAGSVASFLRVKLSSLTIRKITTATIRNWMTVLAKAP